MKAENQSIIDHLIKSIAIDSILYNNPMHKEEEIKAEKNK